MAVSFRKIAVFLALTQGVLSVYLDVSPKYQIVRVGDPVTVLCKAGAPVEYCRIKLPGQMAYNLKPGKPPTSDVTYYGSGFKAGECGVKIENVQDKHNGQITCSVGTESDTYEVSANMTLVVAFAPNPPELQLTAGSEGPNDYKEGETIKATCVIRNGRPAANLTWFIGEEQIRDGLGMPTIYDSVKDDKHTIEQNLTRMLHATDNGKELKCVAEHPGLSPINNVDMKVITVKYPPKPIRDRELLEQFGLVEGAEGRVSVIVEANPQPRFIWSIGTQNLSDGEFDSSGRFEVKRTVNKGDGNWESVLAIKSLTKEDVDREYTLTALNDFGNQTYQISISTSPEPKVLEMGTGTIIIVAVGVLIVILIIAVVLIARAKGRLCFADEETQPRLAGESSDTESADHGAPERKAKLYCPSVFKKKNDKTGPNNETVKPDNAAIPLDPNHSNEGVVYAELDLQAHRPGMAVVRGDDDKTEYAEIIHTKSEQK